VAICSQRRPITVAGPWPIFTAFQYPWASSVCFSTRVYVAGHAVSNEPAEEAQTNELKITRIEFSRLEGEVVEDQDRWTTSQGAVHWPGHVLGTKVANAARGVSNHGFGLARILRKFG
jgi:hypothetical protein